MRMRTSAACAAPAKQKIHVINRVALARAVLENWNRCTGRILVDYFKVAIFFWRFAWKLPSGNSSGCTRSIHFFGSDSSVMARESFFHLLATLGGTYLETRSCAASQKFIFEASE